MDLTVRGLQTVHVKRDSRVFRVGNAFGIETLPSLFKGITKPFVLLLATDATKLSDEQILRAAEQIIPAGLTYLCAWGPDCERVHDLFDRIKWPYEETTQNPLQKLIMTSWHAKESLYKAAWYLKYCAFIAEAEKPVDFECIGISINNLLWYRKIQETFAANSHR
jgi:hypothetical protein